MTAAQLTSQRGECPTMHERPDDEARAETRLCPRCGIYPAAPVCTKCRRASVVIRPGRRAVFVARLSLGQRIKYASGAWGARGAAKPPCWARYATAQIRA